MRKSQKNTAARELNTNIILDRLPESVEVRGKEYKIYSDFRTSILFETMMRSRELRPHEKIRQMLQIYYPAIPPDREEAVKKILWFYAGGKETKQKKEEKNRTRKSFRKNQTAYSFEQDAPYIYAAFRKEYRINLQKIKNEELHWWEFLALFDSLPDDSKIMKIMYWRTCSTSGLPRKEVERLNELKERYKLVDEESIEEKISLELRNQKMQEYVRKRYEEVGMCEQEKPGRN